MEEKVLALSIFKQSRRCYSLLRQLCNMLSPKTLKRMLQKISLKPGVNNIITKYLSDKANVMQEKEKYCVLLWDEMALTPHVQYDAVHDVIIGFEDWGKKRTNKFADHVLVFMLRGLNSGWKMLISYNYCESQTKTPQLVRCIKDIVKTINDSGLKLIATVCDQGTSNVAAINSLLQDTVRRMWQQNKEYRTYISYFTFFSYSLCFSFLPISFHMFVIAWQ